MPTFFKKFLNSDSLYSALQPLLIVTFLYGLTPFRVIKSSPPENIWKLKISYYGYLTAFCTITLYMICIYVSLTHQRTANVAALFRTNISKLGVVLQILTGLIGNTVIFLMAIIQKNKLIQTLTILYRIDELLYGIGVTILYSRMIRYFYCVFLLIIILNSGYLGAAYWLLQVCGAKISIFMIISFVSQHLIFGTTIVMFLCLARLIGRRFIILNQVLVNLAYKTETTAVEKLKMNNTSKTPPTLKCLKAFSMLRIVSKSPKHILQDIMESHQLLCDAANIANRYFTYQLLTIIAISFLIIVFDAYYVLEAFLGKSKREEKFKTVEFVTFFSLQMFLYLISIISIVEGSSNAIIKSEKTAGFVHVLINQSKDSEFIEKLKFFSMQLVHQKVQFTAAGLFNIDRSLYFTICGSITTYLIILLQFTANSSTTTTNNSDTTTNYNETTN